MAKKTRPNLKDYLKTGKRVVACSERKQEDDRGECLMEQRHAFLDLLAPPDLKMWEAILGAGTTVQARSLDAASIREDFRTMDRDRFTFYTLVKKGEPLRLVRLGSQIHDPLALLLKWDETGILTVYGAGE